MSGFNIGGFGGAVTPNTVEPRRTYRWVLTVLGRGDRQFSRQELLLLKQAARPHFKFEKVKMDHVQETVSYAGKQTWEDIDLTWYDTEQNPDISLGIYQWLGSVVNLERAIVAAPSRYKRTAELQMLTGDDRPSETWTMYGTYPLDVDWKGLDYTQNQIQECVAKLSFDRALRSCTGLNGADGAATSMC